MELWTAFLLGLLGSLHCAGMCGPLALAIPGNVNATASFVLSRVAYNSGRVTTYCVLGAIFGMAGKSFAIIGLQRWVSLTAGILILIALLVSTRFSIAARIARPVSWLKNALGNLLRKKSFGATFSLGLLNGLLPCGLVYAACAGAAASAGAISGMACMLAFGLGTVPMMLAIGLAGKKLQFALRFKLQKLIPATLIFVSALLIFRGLALGIPYLSPAECCHH